MINVGSILAISLLGETGNPVSPGVITVTVPPAGLRIRDAGQDEEGRL